MNEGIGFLENIGYEIMLSQLQRQQVKSGGLHSQAHRSIHRYCNCLSSSSSFYRRIEIAFCCFFPSPLAEPPFTCRIDATKRIYKELRRKQVSAR
jgi:hypothetical protein